MVLHALLERSALFDAHVAISPSLRPDPEPVEAPTSAFLERIEQRLRRNWDDQEFLHLSVGDLEGENRIGDVRQLVELLESAAPSALTWRFDLLEGDTHSTASVTGAFRGIRAVHGGWSIESIIEGGSLVELRDHFAMLGERYGCELQIPQLALHRMGFLLLADDRVEDAIAVFSYEIQEYPESATAYDSLAYALEVRGDLAEAIEHSRTALALAEGEEAESIRRHIANLETRLRTRG
jgi:tetratricopeptide (TPR) repeat protein